jgi:hypothetical protein
MTLTAQGNAARPLLAIIGAVYQRVRQQKDAKIASKLRAPSAHAQIIGSLFNAPHDGRQYLPRAERRTQMPQQRSAQATVLARIASKLNKNDR